MIHDHEFMVYNFMGGVGEGVSFQYCNFAKGKTYVYMVTFELSKSDNVFGIFQTEMDRAKNWDLLENEI